MFTNSHPRYILMDNVLYKGILAKYIYLTGGYSGGYFYFILESVIKESSNNLEIKVGK